MKKMNKKASLSTKELIVIIILVVSFAVILYFMAQLSLGGSMDQKTCETSVSLKKASFDNPITGGKLIDLPLKCKTERICVVTDKSQKCDASLGNSYTKIKVSNKEDIKKLIADNMAECWSTLGEGKGNMIFKRELTSLGIVSRGVICKVIDFNETVIKFGPINSLDITKYMNENKVPEKDLTYWEYLLDEEKDSQNKVPMTSDALSGGVIDLKEPYAIVFVESRLGALSRSIAFGSGVVGAGGAVAGVIGLATSSVSAPVIIIGGALVVMGGGSFTKIWDWATNKFGSDELYSSIFFIPYNVDELRNLNIDSFESFS